jgi:hypothetical protein
MNKEHPEFRIERTKDKPLWRYIEFWKFLDLLETSELYFPAVSHLGDQHEGRIPEKVYKMMLDYDERMGRKNDFAQNYKGFVENNLRENTLVSSWNATENESFAMWKMYAKEKLGIAIKTNIEGLQNCFNKTERNIYIGEVNYYNDNAPKYETGNMYYSLMVKHHYYEFESEVRCITSLNKKKGHTHRIEVDLNELIKEIYISPFASKTGLISIIEFLKEKYGLNFKINISGVNDTWI